MDEYDSSFETESECSEAADLGSKRAHPSSSSSKEYEDGSMFKKPKTVPSLGHRSKQQPGQHGLMVEEYCREEKRRRVNFHSLDAYTRHKLLINYYVLTHPDAVARTFTRNTSTDRSDYEVLLQNHRFIWSEHDLAREGTELTWGQRVARKYYEQLVKEYCITDLARFEEGKFGMRWRTEREVVEGKGQFICGAKRCEVRVNLTSWEVLFRYVEAGDRKEAMVKVRLCPDCSVQLNYHRAHRKARSRKLGKGRKSKTRAESTSRDAVVRVKEEIVTEDDDDDNDDNHGVEGQKSYDELIDQIWRQPVKVEPEEEQNVETEVDDYLSQFFM